LICTLAAAVAGVGRAAGNEPGAISLEDLRGLQRAVNLQISADGARLVYETSDHTLFSLTTEGTSEPQAIGGGIKPQWSPDGRTLAFYRSDGTTGALQLWTYELAHGRALQLTHFAGGIDPDPKSGEAGAARFSWSPDGRKIAFASRVGAQGYARADLQNPSSERFTDAGNPPGQPVVFTSNTPHGGALAGLLPGSRFPPPASASTSQIFIVDLRTQAAQQITEGDLGCVSPDWSPGGTQILCSSSEGHPVDALGSPTSNVHVIDLSSLKQSAVTRGPGRKLLPRWSPDGERIAYAAQEPGELWSKSRLVIAAKDGSGLQEIRVRHVREFEWSADGRSLVVLAGAMSRRLVLVDVRPGQTTDANNDEDGTDRFALAVSRAGPIAWLESTGQQPLLIRVRRTLDGSSLVRYDFNEHVRRWRLGTQEVIRWQSGHGDTRAGILIKPAGYRAGERYPLIVDPYPGHGAGFNGDPHYGNQAWASMGYAVFFPNARLPWLWPAASDPDEQKRLQGAGGWRVTLDDILSGVDELIRRGVADPVRMCLYGISNAAGAVSYLVTQTDRFRCAVAVAPVMSDWPLHALLGDDVDNALIPVVLGNRTLWDAPGEYISGSAVYQLHKINTPLLLAAGDYDPLCSLLAVEMYLGLRRLGKTVTLLRYPDQGHGFLGVAEEDFWNRQTEFFAAHLTRVPSETE
jgi:dipeptidyl aminopeptidase/acylaminoacyl peptidase